MKRTTRFFLLTLSLVSMMILSLFNTVTAFADDETPPAPTEEPALPPTEEPTATEVPVATDVPPQEPIATEETNVAEILSQIPEGTDVVVLDDNGQPQALSSQEAADILVTGDPQWCMDGYTPADDPTGLNGFCTDKFTFFNGPGGLIDELTNGSGIDVGNGTIYVAYDYDATVAGDTGDIIFDYGSVDLTNLVFQGGWNFGSNSVTGTTTFGGTSSLQFWDWGAFGLPASLTINDIIVDGGDGLYISDDSSTTTADVTLNNVDVVNTDYGTYIGTDGSVSISNSSFDNTQLDSGLVVDSNGNITLTNVTANGNDDTGAILDNSCGCGAGNIFISSSTFSDNDVADNNDGRGLQAYSNGDINLSNVNASGNAGGGAELDTTSGGGSITLSGTNTFNDNGFGLSPSVGLWAVSNTDIILSGVTANGNGNDPAGSGGGGAFIATSGDVSITNSVFNDNCILSPGICGLAGGVAIFADDVTLNNVTASGNGYGSMLGAGAVIFANGNVLIKDSIFSGNNPFGGVGLGAAVLSGGSNIDIYCSTFTNNAGVTGYGLATNTAGTVTLNGVTFGGNSTGDMDISTGMLVQNPFDCNPGHIKKKLGIGLPLNIVDVSSGQTSELNCVEFRGTLLVLPNGDRVLYPCPLQEQGKLETITQDTLPGALPEGNTFASALTAHLFKGGNEETKVDPSITVSFAIPEGVSADHLAILFWDGGKWVEVDGAHVSDDGLFEAQAKFMGIYVLVTK